MIKINDNRKCSGCMACKNACSLDAISFEEDEEGFWYPRIDLTKCVDCGVCEKVCPFNDSTHFVPYENHAFVTQFYAGQLKEKKMLFEVSSGGAFQAMAMSVILEGGIVYGAAQDDVDHIFHMRASTLDELQKTRRSKYFQSEIGNTYTLAKRDLQDGKEVLFSGTGCQIAGLNSFLNKRYENLYTCEVVCHGVPSRKIWRIYRKEKEEKEGKKIVDLIFRDKSHGWSQNQYRITYDDGSTELEKSAVQLFHAGYLQGLFYRPSCGSCPFASIPRVADVTLADYWQYKGILSENDEGISLIAANNPRGIELLQKCSVYLTIENTSMDAALKSCRHMDEHPTENPNRRAFLNMAFTDGYYAAAREYIEISRAGLARKLKDIIGLLLWR